MFSITGGKPKEMLPFRGSTLIEHVLFIAGQLCDEVVVVWDSEKGALPSGTTWVTQIPQRGLAPAIISGLSSDSDNLVLLPDAIYLPSDPAESLLQTDGDIVLGLIEVAESEVHKFGICELDPSHRVTKMIEKPSPEQTESRWAIGGRYLFRSKASRLLAESIEIDFNQRAELDLSPFFNRAIDDGLVVRGALISSETTRFDTGDPDGYRSLIATLQPAQD